nr:alcohol dehydrogenase catalytic domain-containing protein [Brucella grignonensis]
MGYEAIGVVEAIGNEVRPIRPGQVVIMPFAYPDGSCMFCEDGLHTSCRHGGFFGAGGATDMVSARGPAERADVYIIKGTRYAPRWHFSAEEKIRVVLEGPREERYPRVGCAAPSEHPP